MFDKRNLMCVEGRQGDIIEEILEEGTDIEARRASKVSCLYLFLTS